MGSNNSKTDHDVIAINENTHSKIMRDMSKCMDECKENKQNCQCSASM